MPLPTSVEELFQQLGMSDEQCSNIRSLLPPAAAVNPSFHLLLGLAPEDLTDAGLSPVQMRAWLGLFQRILSSSSSK